MVSSSSFILKIVQYHRKTVNIDAKSFLLILIMLLMSAVLLRITNAQFSDWFMTGVRTSKTGLSMLLIPRDDNIETKIIKTSYSSAAGTAFVTFDKVLVPIKYLMGEEGQGLKVILSYVILSSFAVDFFLS